MEDTQLARILKEYLLAMNRIQESLSAIGLVLKDRGLMGRSEYENALQRVQDLNRENREKMEKSGLPDPMLELLRKFEGPIQ